MNNSIWEQRLPASFKKPSPSATHAVRDRYIRDKYELKKFLDMPEDLDMKECAQEVLRACEINDVPLLFKTIAIGGPSCFLSSNTFPLHAAAKRDASACCMLLLVNGSHVLAKDTNDLTASEVAATAGHTQLAAFLLSREDHILATRSRRNSNASSENSVTGINNLNSEFDTEELQLSMKDLVSKALGNSEDDMESEAPDSSRADVEVVNCFRETSEDVNTTE